MPAIDEAQSRNGSAPQTIIGQSITGQVAAERAITGKLELSDLHTNDDLPVGTTNNNEGLLSNNNEGLLSLKDIEARTGGDNYSKLMRFANQPGIGEHLGAVKVTGAKGVRYEPWAALVFQRLLAAQEAGAVTQSTAVAWLKANEARAVEAGGETAITEQRGITEYPKSGNTAGQAGISGLLALLAPLAGLPAAMRDLAAAVLEFRTQAAPQVTPQATPLPDRLLTAEQAAELLACHPRSVSRYVTPVRNRTWKESDVQRYIQGLGSADVGAAQSEAAK